MFDHSFLTQNDEFNNKIINARTRRQIVTVQENHIFRPDLLNSVRLGFNRSFGASPLSATAVNPLAADTSLGICARRDGWNYQCAGSHELLGRIKHGSTATMGLEFLAGIRRYFPHAWYSLREVWCQYRANRGQQLFAVTLPEGVSFQLAL